MSKGEGLYPAPTRKRIEDLDAQIAGIQKGTRALVPAIIPLHDILRQKFRWYYKWTAWPASKTINLLVLFIYLIGASWFGAHFFMNSKMAKAATITTLSYATGNGSGSTVTNPAGATSDKATYLSAATDFEGPKTSGTEIATADYSNIASSNDVRYTTTIAPILGKAPYQIFRFYIDPAVINKTAITRFVFTHEGYSTRATYHSRTITVFGGVATVNETTNVTDTNLALSFDTTSLNISNYVDSSNYVYFMVKGIVATPAVASTLNTDYVKLDVTTIVPPSAPTITAPNGGESWEPGSINNVIWDTAGSGLKYQVEAQNMTQYDNFNDNSIDGAKWTGGGTSNGVTLAETGGEIKISGTNSSAGNIYPTLNSGYTPSVVTQVAQVKLKTPTAPASVGTFYEFGLAGDGGAFPIEIQYTTSGWRLAFYDPITQWAYTAYSVIGNESTEFKTLKIVYNINHPASQSPAPVNTGYAYGYVYDANGTEHYLGNFAIKGITLGDNIGVYLKGAVGPGVAVDGRFDDFMFYPVSSTVSDDFDTQSDGENPTGWVVAGEPTNGSIEVDSAQSFSTSNSLLLLRNVINNSNINANKNFTALDGIVYTSFNFRADGTTMTDKLFQLRNASGNEKVHMNFAPDGHIYAQSTDWAAVDLGTYSANTWYNVLIKTDCQREKYDVYINGVLKVSNLQVVNTTNQKTISRAQIHNTGNLTSGSRSIWFDSIQIYNEFKNISGLTAADATSASWDSTGWADGTNYLVRNRAYNTTDNLFGPYDHSDDVFGLVLAPAEDVPATPSVIAPANNGTGVITNPTGTSSDYSGNPSQLSASWEIYDDAGLAAENLVWSKYADTTNLTSIVVNSTNGTFSNSLAGQTTLASGTDYWIHVRHTNSIGDSEWSTANKFTTAIDAPTAPTNIGINSLTNAGFNATWTDNSTNESDFKVYISTVVANNDCQDAGTTWGTASLAGGADVATKAISGLTGNTQYCVKVTSTNVAGDSAPAYLAIPNYTLANVPTAPTIDATSSTSLTTIININSNPATTEFAISCDSDEMFLNYTTNACESIVDDSDHWRTFTNWGDASGFTQTGLNVNSSHVYKVMARNADKNNTNLSASTSKFTLSDTPASPDVTNTTLTTSLEIAIAADTNPASTEFAISCDSDEAFLNYTTNACETIADDSDHWRTAEGWGAFGKTDLLANTNHTYKVKSRNGDKVASVFSVGSSKYTLIEIPVISFGDIASASIALTGGTLSNINVGSSGVWFEETSGNTGGGNLVNPDGFGAWKTTNSIIDASLVSSTTYSYKAKAKNGDGTETVFSSPDASQITSAASSPPEAPTIGTPVVASATAIDWHFVDNSTDETGFKIYDGSNNLVATCATSNISVCTETGLSPNTQYSGRYVVAYNEAGNSSSSTNASAVYTLANTPLAPTVNTVDNHPGELIVVVNTNSNPVNTVFAIQETQVSGGKYVQADGSLNTSAVWQNVAQWGNITGVNITGLTVDTQYTFKVRVKNGDDVESPSPQFGPTAQQTTLTATTACNWTNDGTNNLWSNELNWSCAHVPTNADDAILDGAISNDNMTIDISATTGSLTIKGTNLPTGGDTAYTGTITESANLTTDNTNTKSGLFYFAGGTYNAGSHTITAMGNFTLAGGTFNKDTSTLVMKGTGSVTTGGQALNNLQISAIRSTSTSFRSEAHNAVALNTAGSIDLTVNKPSGVVSGDMMIAVFSSGSSNLSTISVASGWNLIRSLSDATNGNYAYAYSKQATGSEPSTYTFGFTGTGGYACDIYAYQGGTVSIDSYSSSFYSMTGSHDPITLTIPQITTVSTNTVLVSLFVSRMADSSTATLSTPVGGVSRANFTMSVPTPTRYFVNSLSDETLSVSGATGTRSSIANESSAFSAIGFMVAFENPPVNSSVIASDDLILSGALTTDANQTFGTGGNAVTIGGNIANSGILTANNSTIYIAGNYTNSGTFTYGTSTVNLNGTGAQTFTAGGTDSTKQLYNLVAANSSGNGIGVTFADSLTINGSFTNTTIDSKLTFNAGSTYTFPIIDLAGTDGHTILLRSSASSAWNLNVDADSVVHYIDAAYSNANHTINDTDGGVDSLNNTNWVFVNAPTAPTIGTPQVLSTTSIRWTFTDNASNETGFKIYDGTNTLKATCATANLTYCDEVALSPNTQYSGRYAVAYNDGGDSIHSADAVAKYTYIENPTGMTNSVNATTISTSATGALSNLGAGQTGFYFTSSQPGSNTCFNNWIQDNLCLNDNLTPNSPYTYTVKARNGDGYETAISDPVSVYTLSNTPTAPSVSANYDEANGYYETISINANSNPDNTLYKIVYDTDPVGPFDSVLEDWTAHKNGDTITHASDLLCNSTYYYKVQAQNSDHDNSNYSPVSFDTTPPCAPIGLQNTNTTATSTLLDWSGETVLTTVYDVSFGTDTQATNLGETEGTATSQLVKSGLNSETTYYFKVRTVNTNGTGAWSGIANFTTPIAGSLLLIGLPGQSYVAGTGIVGDPNPQIAGQSFNGTVYSVNDNKILASTSVEMVTFSTITDSLISKFNNGSSAPSASQTLSSGQKTVSFTFYQAGQNIINMTGSTGSSSPFQVNPAVTSTTDSTVSPSSASLNVGQTAVETITLVDIYGNLISNRGVTVSTNQIGDIISFSSTKTNSNGQITAYIGSGFAHTSTLTIIDENGLTLSTHPQITFNNVKPTSIENPSNFIGTAGNSIASIGWTNPTSVYFDHTEIYRSQYAGQLGSKIADSTVDNSDNYVDSSLTNGTTYFYTLKSVDVYGNISSGTYQLALTPNAEVEPKLPAPTNLRATLINANEVNLAWDAPVGNLRVTGYHVYNADTNIQIDSTVDEAYHADGLSPETTYRFFVIAYNDAGNSGASNAVTIVTKAITGPTPPGPICHNGGGRVSYLVLGNMPSEVISGNSLPDSVSVKVIVADGGGQLCDGYQGTIYFTSTDEKADLRWDKTNSYTFTSFDAGLHEFDGKGFTLRTLGNQIITVTDGTVSGKAEIKVISNRSSDVVFSKAQGVVSDFVNKNATKVNTAVVTATTALLVTPAAVNAAIGLGNILPQLIYWFTQLLQMIGIRKKRKPWGIVFNSQTGQPVSLATVKIYDKEYNRLLESSVTDRDGRFGFLVRPGTFYLVLAKGGFIFPSQYKVSGFFENVYTGGNINIATKDEGAIDLNIPLDPQAKASVIFTLWANLIKINRFLQKIRIPLMAIGVIFAVIMIITNYNIIYALSLALYGILFVIEYLQSKRSRPYGVVSDVFGHPLAISIVRIYSKKTDRLIATDVTDNQGRFKFLVVPGIYYMTAAKPGYIDFKSHIMYLERERTMVTTNIKLKKMDRQ